MTDDLYNTGDILSSYDHLSEQEIVNLIPSPLTRSIADEYAVIMNMVDDLIDDLINLTIVRLPLSF
jgi:hypothetical protein